MKIQIYSKSKVLVNFSSQQLLISENSSMLDVDSSSVFKVYPIDGSKQEIPFAFIVEKIESGWVCSSKFVETTVFPNYLKLELIPPKIFLNQMPILENSLTLKSSLNEQFEINIFKNVKNNLQIKTKNFVFSDCLHSCSETNISQIGDYILISYKTEKNYFNAFILYLKKIIYYNIMICLKIFHRKVNNFSEKEKETQEKLKQLQEEKKLFK